MAILRCESTVESHVNVSISTLFDLEDRKSWLWEVEVSAMTLKRLYSVAEDWRRRKAPTTT